MNIKRTWHLNNTPVRAFALVALGAVFAASKAEAQTFINFDVTASGNALTAPTLLTAANPLRDEYASLGIHFQGATASLLNGGAILRASLALSGSNVLAFNPNARLLNGGTASAPENILFDQPLSSFSIFAAGPNVETVFFARALDVNGVEIADVEATSTNGAFSQLSVNATGIRRIELTAQFLATPRQPFLTFDNLSFTAAPVPAPGALPIATVGFGLIGLAYRKKSALSVRYGLKQVNQTEWQLSRSCSGNEFPGYEVHSSYGRSPF